MWRCIRRQRQKGPWPQGQPVLPSEFQSCQDYTVKPYVKTETNKHPQNKTTRNPNKCSEQVLISIGDFAWINYCNGCFFFCTFFLLISVFFPVRTFTPRCILINIIIYSQVCKFSTLYTVSTVITPFWFSECHVFGYLGSFSLPLGTGIPHCLGTLLCDRKIQYLGLILPPPWDQPFLQKPSSFSDNKVSWI